MTLRKVHTIRVEKNHILSVAIVSDEFDALINDGYDDILIITPKGRFIASIDEWLDYGYLDLDGDAEVRVLHRNSMGRV